MLAFQSFREKHRHGRDFAAWHKQTRPSPASTRCGRSWTWTDRHSASRLPARDAESPPSPRVSSRTLPPQSPRSTADGSARRRDDPIAAPRACHDRACGADDGTPPSSGARAAARRRSRWGSIEQLLLRGSRRSWSIARVTSAATPGPDMGCAGLDGELAERAEQLRRGWTSPSTRQAARRPAAVDRGRSRRAGRLPPLERAAGRAVRRRGTGRDDELRRRKHDQSLLAILTRRSTC